jgi:riboflavin biosynthesis pyrimidine reductase
MIAAGLYDELHLIVCPFVLGGSSSVTPVGRRAFWPHGRIPRYRLSGTNVVGDYIYITYSTIKP